MGETYMHIFPADPRRPKPGWPRLRRELLACGFILEPIGDGIPSSALSLLWQRFVDTRPEGKRNYPTNAKVFESLQGLVETLKVVQLVPPDLVLACDALSIPDVIAALKQNKIVPPEFACEPEESYRPGPKYFELSDDPDRRMRYVGHPEISFRDHGDRIYAHFGPENLFAPPAIPGTNRVMEEWQDFLERWVANPEEVWVDPETGARYGLLDLDWDNTLAVCKCSLEIRSPHYLDGYRAATLLSDITGQEFRFAHYSI